MQTTASEAREIPQTPPDRVAEVAMAELQAELALLGTLDGQDWSMPTDCVGWDVHALTAHLVGEYEEIVRLAGGQAVPRRCEALLDGGPGYMLDVVMVRDVWMHRVDLARATARPLLVGEHDPEIVSQRWRPQFR